ncbi:YehE family protein [Escherichia coli]
MNKYWLSGIIFLAYGLASPAFSSETATLTINGRISPPTCSMAMAMVNGQPQQHCGQLTYNVDTRHQVSSPVKGVTTEVIAADSDSKRRIVLNRYD